MSFTFASWNIESFRGDKKDRLDALCAWLAYGHPDQKPIDVFGIMEVEGVNLLSIAQEYFPAYDFHLTDGRQNKEILIGVYRSAFAQYAFTQKREFKDGNDFMRPGSMVSLRPRDDDQFIHLLFMHAAAKSDPRAFGARTAMFEHVGKLKKSLDDKERANRKDPNAAAKLMVLGDLNTVGMRYPNDRKSNEQVSSDDEIAALESITGLNLAAKNAPHTWIGGRGRSDIDHVLYSDNVQLKHLGDLESGEPYAVAVRGWPELSGAKRDHFAEHLSDHALLVGEVMTEADALAPPSEPERAEVIETKRRPGLWGWFNGGRDKAA